MKHACILIMSMIASFGTVFADDYVSVVVPIVVYDVPGAHGSLWNSHLWLHNGTDRSITFEDDIRGVVVECVGIPCVQPPPLEPGEARQIQVENRFFGATTQARILSVREDIVGRVSFSLRIRDVSRAGMSYGTEVPVVYVSQFTSEPTVLMPVPFTQEFRQSLRIYTSGENPCATFDVSFSDDTGRILHSLTMSTSDHRGGCTDDYGPGYAALHSIGQQFPFLNQPNRVIVIRIAPRNRTDYFAFASITSDSSQHVTVITPDGNWRRSSESVEK